MGAPETEYGGRVSISVTIEEGDLRVRLRGIDRLLAIRREVTVALDRIVGAAAVPRGSIPVGEGTWLRAPGTHIPGLVRHGSYGREPHREFWAVFRRDPVLVIETAGGDYTRIVLGIGDPEGIAAGITRRIDG
jgi:hypothetical protein